MLLKKGEPKLEQVPVTKQPAVIAEVRDLGKSPSLFEPYRQACRIIYLIENCPSCGRKTYISQELTASLDEKSQLTALITQVLGSVPDEFDTDALVGKEVVLNLGPVSMDDTEVLFYGAEPAVEGHTGRITGEKYAGNLSSCLRPEDRSPWPV